MDKRKLTRLQKALTDEQENLVRSLNRNREAGEEILVEKTEDEGDLASISHNKELLYKMAETDSRRLKAIKDALTRLDREEYGECAGCGEDINEKRLVAVPWVTMCIDCQEQAEMEGSPESMAGVIRQASGSDDD
jgi:DnaK suppressor protein